MLQAKGPPPRRHPRVLSISEVLAPRHLRKQRQPNSIRCSRCTNRARWQPFISRAKRSPLPLLMLSRREEQSHPIRRRWDIRSGAVINDDLCDEGISRSRYKRADLPGMLVTAVPKLANAPVPTKMTPKEKGALGVGVKKKKKKKKGVGISRNLGVKKGFENGVGSRCRQFETSAGVGIFVGAIGRR